MKILERHEPSVIGICPHCGSKLEIERGDIKWYTDISNTDIRGSKVPYVTCAACGKDFDVDGWKGIYKLF